MQYEQIRFEILSLRALVPTTGHLDIKRLIMTFADTSNMKQKLQNTKMFGCKEEFPKKISFFLLFDLVSR